MRTRGQWLAALAGIIALGIVSRVWPVGFVLWDKNLGDVLYAAMLYALLRVVWRGPALSVLIASMVLVTAIEAFQLTGIPLGWAGSSNWVVRVVGRLAGTQFAWLDLVAYACGNWGCWWVDRQRGGM